MKLSLVTCISIALLLAGCTVGPDFHPPADTNPTAWGSEPTDVSSVTYGGPIEEAWWTSFHDPELISLESRLAVQNIDLQTALERVHQAEATTQVTASQGLPQVSAESEYTRLRESPNGETSLVEPSPGAPLAFDLFENLTQASWELDLFGKVRRATEAARANTEASVEARHAIALEAIASLAQDYMQLRGTQAEFAIAEANLALSRHNLALVRDQFANGTATTLDIANAQTDIAMSLSALSPLQERIARLIDAIGFLLALPPRALADELSTPQPLPATPPSVPIGLPSNLLLRRPDLRESLAHLHAATAETGVAIASFYPDVTLAAHAGLQGLQLANAFSLPDLEYSVGPSISLPLFQGGRLTGTLKLRRSQQREAALDYRRTLLAAWEDVDDALTAYALAQRERVELADAVEKSHTALSAARQNFAQGTVDFLNVTAAQAALLHNQNDLTQLDTEIDIDLITLYKALGGGWKIADQS